MSVPESYAADTTSLMQMKVSLKNQKSAAQAGAAQHTEHGDTDGTCVFLAPDNNCANIMVAPSEIAVMYKSVSHKEFCKLYYYQSGTDINRCREGASEVHCSSEGTGMFGSGLLPQTAKCESQAEPTDVTIFIDIDGVMNKISECHEETLATRQAAVGGQALNENMMHEKCLNDGLLKNLKDVVHRVSFDPKLPSHSVVKIVLSSTWRLDGTNSDAPPNRDERQNKADGHTRASVQKALMAHGLSFDVVNGVTVEDDRVRLSQILAYLGGPAEAKKKKWICLDDMDLKGQWLKDHTERGEVRMFDADMRMWNRLDTHIIHTDPAVGFDAAKAREALQQLTQQLQNHVPVADTESRYCRETETPPVGRRAPPCAICTSVTERLNINSQ